MSLTRLDNRESTFSMTGSSITHGTFSPTSRTRNPLVPKKMKTEISIKEMTGQIDGSGANFGIQGYNIPKHFLSSDGTPKFSFPKEKDRRYLQQHVKRKEYVPEPGRYNKTMVWKGPLGILKGGTKGNFLDVTIKKSSKLPGPNHYSPTKKEHLKQGKIGKSYRSSYFDQVEFDAATTPAPTSPSKVSILKKVQSVKILPPGKHDGKDAWRVKKDGSPACNNSTLEELEKATKIVKRDSPKINFPKGKRKMFTYDIERTQKNKPSPCQYKPMETKFLHKVMAKPRRY
uniref:Uncharacterized protein n=1 Tax=Euplotes crassus TaxID=5936 RepID=A0A7S3KGM7_EUPCR|mmetsp:Transcript_26479/g.26362  ORF Transcript_26479/g.26362 Transcript_26479/m.26362 type:complete len:287 (+) Transcript_26479:1-861(+)